MQQRREQRGSLAVLGPHLDVAAAHEMKRERLLAIMLDRGAPSLTLTTRPALAWYLEGGRVAVNREGDPVVAVRITEHDEYLVVFGNEADRIEAEELRIDIAVERVTWFEPLPVTGLTDADIPELLREARRSLFPHEVHAYRRLGLDAARAVTSACDEMSDVASERQLAGRIAQRLESAGAETLTLLVGGEDRLGYRHPLPTSASLGRRALIVVCARRDGLVANLSRWVGEAPSSSDLDREHRIALVEADTLAATEPGAALGDILSVTARSYTRHGFEPEEWLRHHQGGPTGYATRDPRALPGSQDTVALGQAFAWNPTAPRAKVEDTLLLGENGFEVLTSDPDWPVDMVNGLARPATLTPRGAGKTR